MKEQVDLLQNEPALGTLGREAVVGTDARSAFLHIFHDADLIDLPPKSGDWLTELKFDGWRCQITIESGGVRVFTRCGFDWTDRLRIIADAAATELKMDSAIVDGELVYPHESGRSTFIAAGSSQITFGQTDLHGIRPPSSKRSP